MIEEGLLPHSSHWGVFGARLDGDRLIVRPHASDPDPNPIIDNFITALRHPVRVREPVVRRGWLERGPGPDPARGSDEFVALPWNEVLDRLAEELQRIKSTYGAEAIFGGSYGWSSAGRFHHAQSQVHRFLNTTLGGYVRSVNTYSAGASGVILPHVMGSMDDVARRNVTWEQIVDHTDVVLAFGGMALKNMRVASGGVSRHIERNAMRDAARRGCRFVSVSPLRSDLHDDARADWLPIVPATDTALMLALVHTLVSEGLHDRAFLQDYCDGWPVFEDYLTGRQDGVPKSAAWAEPICDIPAQSIQALARSLHGKRVLVVVAHSLQRAEHGEQPVWMGAVLAAALGQIGLPGGGYAYALGTMAHYGKRHNAVPTAALPQGTNGVKAFIPVARIADMLHHPGQSFDYNGQRLSYPAIKLAYWAGGNPFHHHQDLNKLARAFQQPECIVVHEPFWTATARHADIVLPATTTLERNDIGAGARDRTWSAMHQAIPPVELSRNDHSIFVELSDRLGFRDAFTEGRDEMGWVRFIYETAAEKAKARGIDLPDFEGFWAAGGVELPAPTKPYTMFEDFRIDPEGSPLGTPTGKIEIFSEKIAGFAYDDCPGHPVWF
ncbi:MAG: molybdopterin-dependent oxidoreductase, partial [Rhodoferax sp.]|nr:molybdopterin-dependent oxidoreductase [Rhodoferax sp.]